MTLAYSPNDPFVKETFTYLPMGSFKRGRNIMDRDVLGSLQVVDHLLLANEVCGLVKT